jgi:hypothetical protein
LQRERTAEGHVVTPKEEIEESCDGRHKLSCKGLLALLVLTVANPEQFASPCVPKEQ